MNARKVNKILGYGLWLIGILKIALIILVLFKLNFNLKQIFSGVELEGAYYPKFYETLATGIATTQLVLVLASVVMIFVNTNEQPEAITGYLIGIGAMAIELITPSIFSFYIIFVVAGLYMKAGSKIIAAVSKYVPVQRTTRKMIKDTDWFYSDNYKEKKSKKIKEDKINKKIDRSEQEADYGDIDGTMYNEKIDGLLQNANIGIILAVTIIIVLVILGTFVYIIRSKTDSITDNNIIEMQVGVIEENDAEDEEEQIEDEDYNSPVVEIKKDNDVKENESKLVQIKNIFNNSDAAQEMRQKGYYINATVVGNKLKAFTSGDGLSFDVEFEIDNNILFTEIYCNEYDPRISAIELILAITVVDCVGQMKGYPQRELAAALGKEEVLNFTINDEGVEMKQIEDGKKVSVKVDLNSSFSFLK